MTESPEFFQAAYKALRNVPAGRVTTYGDIARAVGRPHAARAVGTAMRRNPDAPRTPCHRVVRADGAVGQYMGSLGGTPKKVAMLAGEGVRVRPDGRVDDFDAVRWRFK
jgi:O-6-methylguanine DNA methyltransferase